MKRISHELIIPEIHKVEVDSNYDNVEKQLEEEIKERMDEGKVIKISSRLSKSKFKRKLGKDGVELLKNKYGLENGSLFEMISNGVPDFLVYQNNEISFIECKRNADGLSYSQIEWINKYQDRFDIEIVYYVEEEWWKDE